MPLTLLHGSWSRRRYRRSCKWVGRYSDGIYPRCTPFPSVANNDYFYLSLRYLVLLFSVCRLPLWDLINMDGAVWLRSGTAVYVMVAGLCRTSISGQRGRPGPIMKVTFLRMICVHLSNNVMEQDGRFVFIKRFQKAARV